MVKKDVEMFDDESFVVHSTESWLCYDWLDHTPLVNYNQFQKLFTF
mgnify:CR=1 FL=1